MPQCLLRQWISGLLPGHEESGKSNANNNLDAPDRRWLGALATHIANRGYRDLSLDTCRQTERTHEIMNRNTPMDVVTATRFDDRLYVRLTKGSSMRLLRETISLINAYAVSARI